MALWREPLVSPKPSKWSRCASVPLKMWLSLPRSTLGGLISPAQTGDIAPLGAQGPADADLTRSLRHRREHDVHDADAADQERDRCDQGEQTLEVGLGLLGGFELIERHRYSPVLALVRLLEDLLDEIAC